VKKNKTNKSSIKFKLFFFLIIITTSFIFLLFKDFGLLAYFEYVKQNKEIEMQISQLEKEIILLNEEIENLNQANNEQIELEARKQQIFKKEGERVYRLKEMKTFKKTQ
tara:strand:+ start:79 stop:405 length:327 start_codon:yes stop_codon:yes gene_type:complete